MGHIDRVLISEMKQHNGQRNFYSFGAPVLMAVLVGAFSLSLLKLAVTGVTFQPPVIHIVHSVDLGSSKWTLQLP